MKSTITTLLLLLTLAGSAQCPAGPAQQINAYYEYLYTKFRHLLQIPRHAPGTSCRDTADIYYNTADSAIHWWSGFNDLTFLQHANSGVSDSNHTVQLGEPLNTSGNPSKLSHNTEIPLNGKTLTYWDSLNQVKSGFIRYNDTAQSAVIGPYIMQTIHQADTTHDFYNWDEYRPKNYGYLYSGYKPNGGLAKAMSWTWGYSQGDAGGLSMPDNVFGGGYNILNGVSRRDTGDAALSMRLETSFPVFGEPVFEMHWPEVICFDGSLHRINSFYMGKVDARTLWESNLDNHVYKRTVGTVPGTNWLEFTDNSGEFPSINLTGAFNNSIAGTITFNDPTGVFTQIRSLDGDFTIGNNHGPIIRIDKDGTTHMNVNDAGPAEGNGTTIVGQNFDGSTPPSIGTAQLAVVSQKKGFLPPQMTTTQKNAILFPAQGLMVYDLTLNQMSYFNGTVWVNF